MHYQLHPLQRRWCTGGSCWWVQERRRSGPSPYRSHCISIALCLCPPIDSLNAWGKKITSTISHVHWYSIVKHWVNLLCHKSQYCLLLLWFMLSYISSVFFFWKKIFNSEGVGGQWTKHECPIGCPYSGENVMNWVRLQVPFHCRKRDEAC